MKHTHTGTNLSVESQYPKLVRDKIPEILERNGQTAVTHIARREEYVDFLLGKLIEEATELKHAKGADRLKEEIVEVREVLQTLQAELGFLEAELTEMQDSKRAEHGGFDSRVILDTQPA